LHEQFEHTMIYVTHDQTEAMTFADKVVVMYEGEVVQIGTPEELFDQPAHTFVGYFIGSPGMNILPASIEGSHVQVLGTDIHLDRGYPALSGKTEIGIRPEFVRIGRASDYVNGSSASSGSGSGAGDGAHAIPIEVRGVENIGRNQIVRGQVNGQNIDAIVEEGETVPSEAVALFDSSRLNVYQDSHLVRAIFSCWWPSALSSP